MLSISFRPSPPPHVCDWEVQVRACGTGGIDGQDPWHGSGAGAAALLSSRWAAVRAPARLCLSPFASALKSETWHGREDWCKELRRVEPRK